MEAFNALINDEIGMVMHSGNGLLWLTHYRELPNYKANIIFGNGLHSTFGFHKDAAILLSIMDKSLELIDTH